MKRALSREGLRGVAIICGIRLLSGSTIRQTEGNPLPEFARIRGNPSGCI
ncbi:MAG: hypothetical protein ACE5E5_12925 [Phycisphaerae bacterium]